MTSALLLLTLAQQSHANNDELRFESYLAHIFSAQMSLKSDDTALALRWLSKADPEYRGWEYDYLMAQTDMGLWSRDVGHDAARIEFSPNGRYAATSNLDGTVTLYHGQSLTPIGQLTGHESQVWGLAFSPDGSMIATTSRDFSVRLWDVATRKEVATLGKHPTTPYSCAFSPDGKWLVTPGWQMHPETNRPVGLVSVWDVEERKLHKQWFATDHPISSVAFSPDGSHFVLGCWEQFSLLYRTSDWSLVRRLEPEKSDSYRAVDWVQFSHDGRYVLAAHKDQAARLYDVATGTMTQKYVGKGNATCARFSPDGSRIVTSWTDQNMRVFSLDGALADTLRGHTDSVRCFALQGGRIVSIGEDKTLREWQALGTTVKFDAGNECWSAVPSPDGTMIATGGEGNLVRIWKADGTHVRDLVGAESLVVDVAWSPDGTRVITGSNDGTARVWTVSDGVLRHTSRLAGPGQVRGVDWASSGGFFAVGRGTKLAVFDPVSGEKRYETDVAHGAYSVAVSPDSKWVAAGSAGKVSIINASDGAIVKVLEGKGSSVNEIAWSPDGRTIAISDNGGAIELWSVERGAMVRTIRDMTLACWALAFSPDGKRLAATAYDQTLRLFDVATGAQVFMVRDMPSIGFDVQWMPDGCRLIHADTNGLVTIFDARPVRER